MKQYSNKNLRTIQHRHQFRTRKSLGQNFLTDERIVDLIANGAQIGPEDLVIEIGPGMGALTQVAARRGRKVIAVEIDSALFPILGETLAGYDNVKLIHEDILKINLRNLIENETQCDLPYAHVRIIGNLPYYITTPIVMKLLKEAASVSDMTIMMQKEVADRIKAAPGGKIYGGLSVTVQYYCTVSDIAVVPRTAFDPQPGVDSAVLRLEPRPEKPVRLLDESFFFTCIRAAFHSRRKTLLNNLTGLAGLEKTQIRKILEECGVEPSRRAETLSVEEFARVSNCLKKRMNTCQS